MNDNVDSLLPAEPDESGATGDAPAKPVRRKRAAPVASAEAVDRSTPDGPAAGQELAAAAASDDETAPPKPRRRRASTAAPADGGEASPDAPVVAVASASVDAEPKPHAVDLRSNDTIDGRSPSNDSSDEVADSGAAQDAAPAEGTTAASDGARSDRSRRRNRRDRNRRGERDGVQAGDSEDDMENPAAEFVGPMQPRPAPPVAEEVFAQVMSGAFDIDTEAPPEDESGSPTKRVLLPEPDAPKLHKVLAQSGIGSRRDMEELIADGRITVNGEPAHTGQRVSFGDQVHVSGKLVRLRIVPPPPRIIAYHKPVGEIVSHDDPQHRPTVFRRLPRLQQGKWQSVGRLDINTEGLLLFTNSGGLANQLMHPRFGVEREYAVRVLGTLGAEDKARLLEGVDVEGQKAQFRSIAEGGGEGANHWYRVVITEGRNREVRKLFDVVGLTVSRLIRIRYGTVVLPHGLKRGVWTDLDEADVRAIRRLASADSGEPGHAGERQNVTGQPARRDDRQPPAAHRQDRQGGQGNHGKQGSQGQGSQGQPGGGQGGQGGQRNDRQRPQQHGAPNNNGPRVRYQEGAAPERTAAELREPHFERDDDPDTELDHGPIPNPLEQTFDKRFVQNPRSPAGGRGFGRGGGGFGAGGSAPPPAAPHRGPGPKQPDPMQTSVGYIGADAFHRKNKNRGGPRGGGGGGGSGGGGGFGGNTGGGGGFGGGGGGNFGGGGGRRGR